MLQTRAGDRHDDVEARALSTSSRAVFSLFLRFVDAPQLLPLGIDCGLLHVTRLVPFCQLYGGQNPEAVADLLTAIVDNVAAFQDTLQLLQQLYLQQLCNLQDAKQQVTVTQQIYCCHELSLALYGMTAAHSVTRLLILGTHDLARAVQTPSVLFGLVQCYEMILPALQRQVPSFDDKRVPHEMVVLAEARRTMLLVLGRCIDAVMDKPLSSESSGEELVTGLHALTNGCGDQDAEEGSYLSDLWYLCGYKDNIRAFFKRYNFDDENLAYLEMVLEHLPRRRMVPMTLVPPRAAISNPPAFHDNETNHQADEDATEPEATELNALVHQVQECFPDLGDGYIELCLLSTNRHVEDVINYLLEGNPPPLLLNVPHTLLRSDPECTRLRAQVNNPVASRSTSKLDPRRVWVGKKPMETTYDPQLKTKNEELVEKMKQFVAMYEEEDDDEGELSIDDRMERQMDGESKLDEYDDEYNDEFAEGVPFHLCDGTTFEDQDAICEENRRIRAREEKEAFWEGMKNRNREEKEEEDEREGEMDKEIQEGGSQKDTKPDQKRDTDGPPQQLHRQRARKDKNKAKVANHHRKARAFKKMG